MATRDMSYLLTNSLKCTHLIYLIKIASMVLLKLCKTHKPHKLICKEHNGRLQKRTHDQDTLLVRWKEIDTIWTVQSMLAGTRRKQILTHGDVNMLRVQYDFWTVFIRMISPCMHANLRSLSDGAGCQQRINSHFCWLLWYLHQYLLKSHTLNSESPSNWTRPDFKLLGKKQLLAFWTSQIKNILIFN